MKITNNGVKPITFEEIEVGEVFEFRGSFYIKINSVYNYQAIAMNAVTLANGNTVQFRDDCKVTKPDCELIIH